MNIDTTAAAEFQAFERTGWQTAASPYHDFFESLTTQTLDALLDAVGTTQGTRLLDLATGPGYAAAAAARRGAVPVGVDLSSSMVALARGRHPGLTFQEADAEQLPFPDGSFDAVVCNFGLLHMGRPEQALTEARRVLRRGGRVGFAVWALPEKTVGFGMILDAIREHGTLEAPLPPGPPFFRFSDPEECQRILRGAGFTDTKVAEVPQVWKLPSTDVLFDAMYTGTVRTGGLLRAQSKEAQEAIRAALRRAGERYRVGTGIELPMPAVLATAVS